MREGPVQAEFRTFTGEPGRCAAAVHEHVALVYYTQGEAVVEQRGELFVKAGDVHLVPAGEPHRLVTARDGAAWGVGFCAPCFATTELGGLFEPFDRVRAGASAVFRIPEARQEHLESLCRRLHEETTRPVVGLHGTLVQKSLLALILAEVGTAASVNATTDLRPTLVGEALGFIERYCLGPISLDDVARAVRRSPAYVTHTLKRATGKSVGEWIIAGRLAEARNRLLHSDEFVEIIAERVGYADPTHFIRLFRRVHGVTPAAWRAERRGRPLPSRGRASRRSR
jgi:AraC-like DNA-binding protein